MSRALWTRVARILKWRESDHVRDRLGRFSEKAAEGHLRSAGLSDSNIKTVSVGGRDKRGNLSHKGIRRVLTQLGHDESSADELAAGAMRAGKQS